MISFSIIIRINVVVYFLVEVVKYVGYCSSVIIDENQLSPAQNTLSTTELQNKK